MFCGLVAANVITKLINDVITKVITNLITNSNVCLRKCI